MAVKVKDTDNGYKKMRRLLFTGSEVLIGITEEVGAQLGANGRATILQIAIWNEFGTGNAPSRKFLRGWFDQPENREMVISWIQAMMPGIISGDMTKEQAMNIIGLRIVGAIQQTMTGPGIPPPNAEATIRKKKSSTATVDTGVLRSKITHVVRSNAKDVKS